MALGERRFSPYNSGLDFEPEPEVSMKSMRFPMISLVLALAGAMTAAWGAESVMNLISSGEAVQKEVMDTKAKMETAVQKNKDMVAEGKQLTADENKIKSDIDAWTKENDGVKQRTAEYQTRCGADKQLTPDQFKACNADKDQLNADIAKVNSENAELNKRNTALNTKIPVYNDQVKAGPGDEKSTYDAFNAATKKEGAWLDAAREQLSSEAFKSYGAKAGCPDMNKAPKTTDAMIKMTDDVIACLKKVSNS